MSIDCHLKLDGIEGESTHKDHAKELDILSWGWAVNNATRFGHGGGGGQGKAEVRDLVFTHVYDKSSPLLAKFCASGKHIDSAKLTVRKSGDGQKDFLTITLKPVMVTRVEPQADANGQIIETFALAYEDIEFDYKPQDTKGGLGGSTKFGWNLSTTEKR